MIATMDILDHMKTRLGMYVPVNNDGGPTNSVWMVLLREVVEGGIWEFRSGRATRLEIRSDETDTVSIRYDGICKPPERMFAMCNGDTELLESNDGRKGWYDGLELALLNVLSEQLEIDIIHDGRWRKLVSGHGQVGSVEELLPLFPRQMSETCVRFRPCDEYREASDGNIYKGKLLKNMGKAIAFANPGLRVTVNGVEMVYKDGVGDILWEVVARSEKRPLIAPRQACFGTAKISLAIVSRTSQGRRITLRTFVNGWESQKGKLPEVVIGELSAWIASCPILRQGDYECVCVVEGRFPGGDLWQNGLKYAWSGANVTFDFDCTLSKIWRNDIKRCWVELFKDSVA